MVCPAMQAYQVTAEQQVQQLSLALREAQANAELQLQQLGSSQAAIRHAVQAVRSELQAHQQKALLENLTVSADLSEISQHACP